MLRPRPTFPLQNSIVDSPPATTGQTRGSDITGADRRQSERPAGGVCEAVSDGGGEGTGREVGVRELGRERGKEEEEEGLLEQLTERSTRCSAIKLDTWIQRRQVSHTSLNQLDTVCVCVGGGCTVAPGRPATG